MTDLAGVQRRTIVVLSAGQVLGGISFGATISLGAVLAAKLSGDDALSGLATASITLGRRSPPSRSRRWHGLADAVPHWRRA